MIVKQYEIETTRRVYDNTNGGYISIGPDSDGLGLLEIKGGDEFGGTLIVCADMAKKLAEAIALAAYDLERK